MDFVSAFWPSLLPVVIIVALILYGDELVRGAARLVDRNLTDADVARHRRFNIAMTSLLLLGFLIFGITEFTA